MEKGRKRETALVYWGYIAFRKEVPGFAKLLYSPPIMENQMENNVGNGMGTWGL